MTPEALENLNNFIRLVPLGFLVATYGSMIGAGGGFVLVPLLFLLMPEKLPPGTVTSMSLTVVFCNAYAGTLAYARMGRVNYSIGVLFALAGIPAVVLGTTAVRHVPAGPFQVVFGILLCALGLLLVVRPAKPQSKESPEELKTSSAEASGPSVRKDRTRLGAVVTAYIEFCSGFLGIGGGVIQVPFLIRVMHFRPHVATATSYFILCMIAFTGVTSHAVHDLLNPEESQFFPGLGKAVYLAIGGMMGAPVGAAISQKIRGSGIVRLLAVALVIAGARLFWKGLA